MNPPAIVLALASSVAWIDSAPTDSGAPIALVGLRQDAQPPQMRDAATAFDEGEAAYARGDYARAVGAFREAQRLAPHPYTEFNLALALARDDRQLEAWRIFERLAQEAEESDQRDDAAQQLATLRTQLASVRVVTADGTGACIDGFRQEPGTEWIVLPGTVRITRPNFEQEVAVRAGEARVVDLRFWAPPSPQPQPSPRAIGPLLGVAAVSATAATGAAVVAAVENRDNIARGWMYGAAGASALAVGTVVAALTLHFRTKRRNQRGPASAARPLEAQERPDVSCPAPNPQNVLVRTVP